MALLTFEVHENTFRVYITSKYDPYDSYCAVKCLCGDAWAGFAC